MPKHEITPDDIMPLADYAKVRAERRRAVTAMKQNRRVAVGPDATFYFENRDTMWHQIHEMLFIEKGGADQVEDELRAYNPLIPKGRNLSATFMIEIEDSVRRERVLKTPGGIEETIALTFAGETVKAVPEGDEERTTPDGKTSSVHFLLFPFTPQKIAAFRAPGTQAMLAVNHPNYGHIAILPETVRAELAKDFD